MSDFIERLTFQVIILLSVFFVDFEWYLDTFVCNLNVLLFWKTFLQIIRINSIPSQRTISLSHLIGFNNCTIWCTYRNKDFSFHSTKVIYSLDFKAFETRILLLNKIFIFLKLLDHSDMVEIVISSLLFEFMLLLIILQGHPSNLWIYDKTF